MVDKLKYIVNNVSQLNNNEKIHVLNIIMKSTTKYTKNKNGYLFNLNDLGETDIQRIYDCVVLILENRRTIYEMDKLRREQETRFTSIIDDTLKESEKRKKDSYLNRLLVQDTFDLNYDHSNSSDILYYSINRRMSFKLKGRQILDPDMLMIKYKEDIKNKYKQFRIKALNMKEFYKRELNTDTESDDEAIQTNDTENSNDIESENDDVTNDVTSEVISDVVSENDNESVLSNVSVESVSSNVSVESVSSNVSVRSDVSVKESLFTKYQNILSKSGMMFYRKKKLEYESYTSF